MRDFLLGVLSFAVIGLGVMLIFQERTIQAQAVHLNNLTASVSTEAQEASLDLQAKCAKQAKDAFDISGAGQNGDMASYTDHYNSALNKCFVFVQDTDYKTNPKGVSDSETLYDAFELQVYGSYFALTYYDDSKPPAMPICTFTAPDGKQTFCHSRQDFRNGVEYYMGTDPN